MSNLITIARPYAKAIFELARDQLSVDKEVFTKWDNNLNYLSQLMKNSKVQQILNGCSSVNEFTSQIISFCGEDLDDHAQNLFQLMAENNRLSAISEVYTEFKNYVNEYLGVANVEVVSAFALNAEQQQKIAEAMERKLSTKVNLSCSIDQSLIAGVIIRTKDLVIDGSTRGQLNRLAVNLQD